MLHCEAFALYRGGHCLSQAQTYTYDIMHFTLQEPPFPCSLPNEATTLTCYHYCCCLLEKFAS